MPLVTCPSCRQALTVPDGSGGAVVTCPACQKPMTLPPDAPVAVVAAQDFIDPFAVPDPEPRHPRDRDPAPAGRERKTDWTPVALVGAAGVLGLIGVVVVVWVVAGSSKATPTEKDKQPEHVKGDRPAPPPKGKAEPAAATTPGGRMDDATVARIKKATVYIRITDGKKGSSGSGFFVDRNMVVTNNHVINPKGKSPNSRIEVVVESGTAQTQTFPARVVGADAGKDLALIEVLGATAPDTLKVSDTAALRETHDVYAFGFPLGENLGQEITVTKTTVSSLRRGSGEQIVQLNGGLHPGNSGGPITDSSGKVVGVAVAVIRDTQIHLAIAGEEVQSFLARFLDR